MPLRMFLAMSNAMMLLIGSTAALKNPESTESTQFTQLEKKNPSQSDFTIKTQVALVSLDAVVRNPKGEFIDELQQSDFKIYDNEVAQKIALFSHDYKPLDIALVIDASSSEQKYRSQLRAAALDVLQKMNPKEDRVALFYFGTFPIHLTGLTMDRSLIIGSFERIPELGSTNIADALLDATQYLALQPRGHRRAILLISDNKELISPQLTDDDRGVVQDLLEADVTLISIKTPGTKSRWGATNTHVSKIAADTGGEVLDASSLDALTGALSAAVLRLKNSYVIGFYPSDERNPGSYHELKIIFNKNKCSACKIWTRRGYYAGGQAIAASDSKKNAGKSTSLAPKKAYWGPWFGAAMVLTSSSPQEMLYSEALTKRNRKKTKIL
jgi:VWFA-related protein